MLPFKRAAGREDEQKAVLKFAVKHRQSGKLEGKVPRSFSTGAEHLCPKERFWWQGGI